MPLAAFDFLPSIIVPVLAADFSRLHRLTVDARGTGSRLPACFPPHSLPQGCEDLAPRPTIAPLREIVVHAAFGEQVMRKHVPLAATAVQIQERVEDLA